MKKKLLRICIVLLAIVLVGGIVSYIVMDRLGDMLIRNFVESLDEDTLAALEQGLEQMDPAVLELNDSSEPVSEQLPPEASSVEEVEPSEEPVPPEAPTSEPTQEQAPEVQAPVQQTPPAAPKPEADTSKAAATSKLDQIEYQDKIAAISLVKNKFSISEIAAYQERVIREGITSALLSELKRVLKARCSAEEIQQLRVWYNKYK